MDEANCIYGNPNCPVCPRTTPSQADIDEAVEEASKRIMPAVVGERFYSSKEIAAYVVQALIALGWRKP